MIPALWKASAERDDRAGHAGAGGRAHLGHPAVVRPRSA